MGYLGIDGSSISAVKFIASSIDFDSRFISERLRNFYSHLARIAFGVKYLPTRFEVAILARSPEDSSRRASEVPSSIDPTSWECSPRVHHVDASALSLSELSPFGWLFISTTEDLPTNIQ